MFCGLSGMACDACGENKELMVMQTKSCSATASYSCMGMQTSSPNHCHMLAHHGALGIVGAGADCCERYVLTKNPFTLGINPSHMLAHHGALGVVGAGRHSAAGADV